MLDFSNRQSDKRASQRAAHLVESQDVVEVKRHERSCWDLEQLQCVDTPRVLLPQVQQVLYVQEVSLLTLDGEADLLIDLLFIEEEH